MPVGLILLIIVAVLVYFGIGQRVLDRMNLTDTQALIFLGMMIAGSFVNIPLTRGEVDVSINVGGALIPLLLVGWLIYRAGTGWEKWRGPIAGIATGIIVWGFSRLMRGVEPEQQFLDPLWVFSIVAGVIGYLAGRSRRSAFIAGILGIIVADIIHMMRALALGEATTVAIGGAGVFDAVVIAGLIAVALAELVGESRERAGDGPLHDKSRSIALDNEEFAAHEFGQMDKTGAGTGPGDATGSNEAENPAGQTTKARGK